jgi:hypothetical protein
MRRNELFHLRELLEHWDPMACIKSILAVACIISVCFCFAIADEANQFSKACKDTIEELINQLATKNPAPANVKGANYHYRYPDGWKYERQDVVVRAAEKLVAIGTEAFPQLIDHLGDNRYSYSDQAIAAEKERYYRRTVGYYCNELLVRQVDHHFAWGGKFSDLGIGPTLHRHPPFLAKDTISEWWATNRKRPLWELQADAFRWAIDVETASIFADSDQAAASQEAIRKNREALDGLIRNKKPFPTKLPYPISDK